MWRWSACVSSHYSFKGWSWPYTDNVRSWNPSGVLLGKLAVGNGGVNNFAFVPGGMYIFNAQNLFKVTLKAEGRTVKRDFGLY